MGNTRYLDASDELNASGYHRNAVWGKFGADELHNVKTHDDCKGVAEYIEWMNNNPPMPVDEFTKKGGYDVGKSYWQENGNVFNISKYFSDRDSPNSTIWSNINFTVIAGGIFFVLWWFPGMWWTTLLGTLTVTTGVYSFNRCWETGTRMANDEGDLIDWKEWAETLGIGMLVSWPVLIWAGTETFGRMFGIMDIWGGVCFPKII